MPLDTSKREAKRDELFEAALEVMGRHGFADATVEQITRKAGVARSVFYYYFESKADLVVKMIESSNERLFEAYDNEVTSGMSTEEMFLAIARTTYRVMRNRPQIAMFFFSEIWHRHEKWRAVLGEGMNEVIFVFADLIEKGQEEGLFDRELNVSFASQMVFSAIGTTAAAHAEGYILDDEKHDIGEQVVTCVYRALSPGAAL